MKPLPHSQTPTAPFATYPLLAWFTAALSGVIAPAFAMAVFLDASTPAPMVLAGGAILAVGLMAAGMIAAAAAGRFWAGTLLALLTGAGLLLLGRLLGLPPLLHPVSVALAIVIASISFAARGALFARSALGKGWLIAVCVVAGEAAIVLTALLQPDALPDWLLALLPAQWATSAIQTALAGTGILAARSALLALSGTAAATLLVVWLWPRRWTYGIMFTVWLGLSALVYHHPAPPILSSVLATAPVSEG